VFGGKSEERSFEVGVQVGKKGQRERKEDLGEKIHLVQSQGVLRGLWFRGITLGLLEETTFLGRNEGLSK